MIYFETKRLTGRSFQEKDRESAMEILMDPTVKLTYMLPDFADQKEAGKLFLRLMDLSQKPGHYVIAICLDDRLIGWINDTEQKYGSIELGYVMHPCYQNQGYMTEAVEAAVNDLFARGYTEVVAGAFEENLASIRVMEKLNFMPEGLSRRCLEVNGVWEDHLRFSLLNE